MISVIFTKWKKEVMHGVMRGQRKEATINLGKFRKPPHMVISRVKFLRKVSNSDEIIKEDSSRQQRKEPVKRPRVLVSSLVCLKHFKNKEINKEEKSEFEERIMVRENFSEITRG